MSNITETQQDNVAQDSVTKEFAKLLEESFEINQINEGKIVKGTVISIESDLVIVDVGLKTEGRISLSKKLLNHAKIKSNILFFGLGKTFQIWEPKNFEKFKSFARKKAFQNRSNLKWENKQKGEL